MIPFYLVVLITAQLLIVSYLDFRLKKILNIWPLLNLALAIGIAFYSQSFEWMQLLYPLGIMVIGFLLFLPGIMGAGDSKYMASLFILIPLNHHEYFLTWIILATFIWGLFFLSLKLFKNFSQVKQSFYLKDWKSLRAQLFGSSFSYAIVMLTAWIGFLWQKF